MNRLMKFSLAVIMIISVAVLAGYMFKGKDYGVRKRISKEISEEAVKQIESKYDMDVKVVDVNLEKENTSGRFGFSPAVTGNGWVRLSDGWNEFDAYVLNRKDGAEVYDNYNHKMINGRLIDYINSKVGRNQLNYRIEYGEFHNRGNGTAYNGLIKECYTGSNIEEIIEKNHFRVIVEYKKTCLRFTAEKLNDIFKKEGNYFLVVNYSDYDSESRLDDYCDSVFESYTGPDIEEALKKEYPYIDSALLIKGTENEYKEIKLK